MRTRSLVVSVLAVAVLGVTGASVLAQRGPGPGRGGPQGFGWGPGGGVQFLGMGGCFFEERGFAKKSSTPYGLSVTRIDTRAVLSSTTPAKHTETYTMFRDSNGVTYLVTATRDNKTLVCINDPANHVRFVVNLSDTNTATGPALEFKLPTGNFGPGKGPRPPQGNGDNNVPKPAWNGKAKPDVVQEKGNAAASDIPNYVTSPPPSWFSSPGCLASEPSTSALDLTVFKRNGQVQSVRVFCSSLGVNLYTFMGGPSETSMVTATIQSVGAPPSPADLHYVAYNPSNAADPLSPIPVKVVDGRPRGRGPHGPPAPPQP